MQKENAKVVVKLVCFPGEFLSGVSRFFVSDRRSSVRSKIRRCRFFRRPQDRQNTDFNVGLTPDLSRPSSPRNVSMRGIGAEEQSAPLYPAFARPARTGMTNGADRFSRSVIPQGFYAGYSERNVKAFTLIELLVVVLIIGILAAVALPQYKKAVWKSRNTQLKTVAATVNQAQQNYRLANGSFTRHFQELSIDLPLASSPGTACGMSAESDSGRYTSNFEVQLYAALPIIVWYTSGPYQCAGFAYDKDGKMWCVERDGGTHFPGTAGSFCAKVEKATFSAETTALYDTFNTRFYQLP